MLAYKLKKQYCEDYAHNNQLKVVQYFGGTYESAKKDDRLEFQKMLKYVRNKNNKISYILVYAYDRFSRTGASSIGLSEELKTKGILIVSVTQPINFNDQMSSVVCENLFHLNSHITNIGSRNRIISGMRSKLLKGYWLGVVPFGYTNLNPGKGKTPDIVINEDGKLLKLAFQWRLHKNMNI